MNNSIEVYKFGIIRFFLWCILFCLIGSLILLGGFMGWLMNQSIIHSSENDTRNLVTGVIALLIFGSIFWFPLIIEIKLLRAQQGDAPETGSSE